MIESGGTPSMLSKFFSFTVVLNTHHNMPYMQSTGLFDKNGKEIFEGDITIVHYGNPENESYIDVIDDIRKDCNFEPDAIQEVIGNIYENPELLEVK
jgi:uncharacterized phage protein (TIGR01671 family)